MANKVTSMQDTNPNQNLFPICRILKPIHFSMQVFGVFFLDTSNETGEERKPKSQKCQSSFFKWYCICLAVISCLNILRYIPSFWVGVDYVPDITVWRIINLSWLIQCFINRVVLLRACWSRDHLQTFFRNFNKIIADTSTCSSSMDSKCDELTKLVNFRTVVTWLCVVFTFTAVVFQSVTEYNRDFAEGITNPFPQRNAAVKLVFVSLHLLEAGAWMFPVLFQVTLFTFLRNHFSALNNDILRMIEENGERISHKVTAIRRKHLQLCKAVAILEQDTKYLILGNYATNIFLICFIVYQMVASGTLPAFAYVTFSSWLVMNVFIALAVSVLAAQVNEQAHSPLEYIYDVDMREASAFESVELQMFLSKLNGPAIGFTAMGFVTITKEFILTLGGIFLTYFFLLIQFKL